MIIKVFFLTAALKIDHSSTRMTKRKKKIRDHVIDERAVIVFSCYQTYVVHVTLECMYISVCAGVAVQRTREIPRCRCLGAGDEEKRKKRNMLSPYKVIGA